MEGAANSGILAVPMAAQSHFCQRLAEDTYCFQDGNKFANYSFVESRSSDFNDRHLRFSDSATDYEIKLVARENRNNYGKGGRTNTFIYTLPLTLQRAKRYSVPKGTHGTRDSNTFVIDLPVRISVCDPNDNIYHYNDVYVMVGVRNGEIVHYHSHMSHEEIFLNFEFYKKCKKLFFYFLLFLLLLLLPMIFYYY